MQTVVLVTLLALIMGVAIQRGTTCAVRAVEELMRHHRPDRFLSFFECGLWAALTLMLFGTYSESARPWMLSVSLLGGACLFGVGAAINGACAFGTIGKIGNGRLEYVLTVVAAYGGIQAVPKLEAIRPPLPSAVSDTGLTPIIAVSLLIGVMAVRWRVRRRMLRSFVILGILMAIIGCTGAILGHFLQPWPWMNALTALPDVRKLTVVGLLFLIGGAMVSAIANGQFRVTAPTISDVGKRVVGGALMGMGTVLVPGGNDALILYGVPHGDMLAVFAYLTMLLAIAGTLLLTRSVSPPWSRPSV